MIISWEMFSEERRRLEQYGFLIKTLADSVARNPLTSDAPRKMLDAILAEKRPYAAK